MSAAMPQQLADAAAGIAIRAEATAKGVSIPQLIRERIHAKMAARERSAESLAGQTWREMPMNVRTVLVMLEANAAGDPRVVAAQPWGSFSDSDRAALGAAARSFKRSTQHADYLR